MELFEQVMFWAGTVITGATMLQGLLEYIAGITPSTKDDEFVTKTKKYLGFASAILDKLSILTPKK
jgi:hypothetical protein